MKALILLNGWSAWRTVTLFLVGATLLAGCSSSETAGVGTGGTGSLVALDVTDAPAIDYAHVYVTVTSVAFNTDAFVAFSDYSTSKSAGWEIVRLATPRTVDLAQLTNGTMYADLNGNTSLFSGMNLPVGNYQQIRIFLASTEDAYVGSAPSLVYNNEVQLDGDTAHYPLRVPSSDGGIKVLPESPVTVTIGSTIRLALDFNLNDDVVKVTPNGSTEYIFKPRLGYFDMGRVGSVKGAVSFSNFTTSRIEVKAEQIKNGSKYRTVRRTTSVDRTTGKFNLYPLPVFGTATTASYDILVRGRNMQTAIVKGVKVHRGTNPTNSIDLGTITMQPDTEFVAQVASSIHPTGAWLNFYQAIAGDSIPYEVRYRHLDPYTGKFTIPLELSNGAIQVATFNPGSPLSFIPDNTSKGKFFLIADAADFYDSGAVLQGITGATVPITMSAANYPQMDPTTTAGKIKCIFDMALLGSGTGVGMGGGKHTAYPSKGQVFVTHDGMIIDSLGDLTGDTMVNAAMHAGGGTGNYVELLNIPSNNAKAVYGVYVLGWGNNYLAAAKALDIDLRKGGIATVTLKIK